MLPETNAPKLLTMRLSITPTSAPSLARARARLCPMNPAPPTMATRRPFKEIVIGNILLSVLFNPAGRARTL